jgi:hypothetical protein
MKRLVAILSAAALIVAVLLVGTAWLHGKGVRGLDMLLFTESPSKAVHEPRDLGPRLEFLAFVGQQISIEEVDQPEISGVWYFDRKYQAKFKVLDTVYGKYPHAEIEFEVFSHGQNPPYFTKYKTVLMYVSRFGDIWIHEKYLFNPVYSTEDGSWAGCGDPYRGVYGQPERIVSAENVYFDPPVEFDLEGLSPEEIEKRYPKDHFIRGRKTATCYRGARPHSLFVVKRESVLKARGTF